MLKSLVDMCPKPIEAGSSLSKKSHVEEFPENIPALFNAVTSHPDPEDRWTSFTYPIDLDISLFAPKKEVKFQIRKFLLKIEEV